MDGANSLDPDLERNESSRFLMNQTVRNYCWKGLTVTVKDRETKKARDLINDVNGDVQQGELVALMGPSGCGKTTLLNVLAHRTTASRAKVSGKTYVNGHDIDMALFGRITTYVEQEDALIGSLTVQETLRFAADLSLPSSISQHQRIDRVKGLLKAFGIQDQVKTLKRRVSVASQLITVPKIIFLDEPTSGLDSTASYEVVSYARQLARANNLLIIASIHQPSSTTFALFDKLLLLSAGRSCYFGPVEGVERYFAATGYPIPVNTNPAEYLLDIVSSDFGDSKDAARDRVKKIHASWAASDEAKMLTRQVSDHARPMEKDAHLSSEDLPRPSVIRIISVLLHRSFIKSYRDVVAYGIRIVMYLGLAIMMGTVWLRLHTSQEYIQPFINAIFSIFFGSAFMSFTAVAYVPAFLEDRATFVKERANGLYGATPFMVSNFIIGLPFLFLITMLFSTVSYWLTNFAPGSDAFFYWVMWIFLDLLAAESLVVLVAAIFPNFVISLALVAFANGLWMSVGGFLVPPNILNVFLKYVFHYIDYQIKAYVFQGMMVNELSRRSYSCGTGCQCMYQTDLAPQCQIRGTGVLDTFGYATGRNGKWAGILLGIIAGYRLFGWIALVLRRS
ncbi:P-loop containing nucleoside triphosphate hydrolase protein [Aspergillus heterothallicus]